MIEREIENLQRLIFPSRDAMQRHEHLQLPVAQTHLPYFLPDEWSDGIEHEPVVESNRPYIAAAGRLVRMKGFHRLIPLMGNLPHIDLKIAGTGPYESELRRRASHLPNVHFLGLCDRTSLLNLFHNARAVVVPSLFPETFGYVVLEAFAVRTPVIVHRGGGAIAETGEKSGGGIGYDSLEELERTILALVNDHQLRQNLACRGYEVHRTAWSESSHLNRYLGLIQNARHEHPGKYEPSAVLNPNLLKAKSAVSTKR